MDATTINGLPAGESFDGVYTEFAPVPEPSTVGFGIAALLGAFGRRARTRLKREA